MPWRLRRSCHLAQLASRFVSRLASQQCTQMPRNGSEGPFWPICVHYCVPTVARTILAKPNSVHKCPNPAPRGPILPFVYTIVIPRPPTTQAHGATVYTNALKRRRETILANLCTLLRPHGCLQQCNSVHKCPKTARRGPILPFVYTIVIPRPLTTQAHGATVYTNAPKRRREAIFAHLCTLLRRRLGGEIRPTGAMTQPPTHTNSRSLSLS